MWITIFFLIKFIDSEIINDKRRIYKSIMYYLSISLSII